jgi:hypothetical protein
MASKSDVKIIYDKLVGNTTSDPTLNSSSKGYFITTATRGSTGVFTLAFRRTYPELKHYDVSIVNGTTAYLRGTLTAIDVTAGTATLKTDVNGTLTDPGTSDVIYITLHCRKSGKNT